MKVKPYQLIFFLILMSIFRVDALITIPMYEINDHYLIQLKKGQIVAFNVSDNPSLGQHWSFNVDESYISIKETPRPPSEPGLKGASILREFELIPKKEGKTSITASKKSLGPTRTIKYEFIITNGMYPRTDLPSALNQLTQSLNDLTTQINRSIAPSPAPTPEYWSQILPKDIQDMILKFLGEAPSPQEGIQTIKLFLPISMRNYNPNDTNQAATIITMIAKQYEGKISAEEIATILDTPGAKQWLINQAMGRDPIFMSTLQVPKFFIPKKEIEKNKKYQITLKAGQEIVIEAQENESLGTKLTIASKNPQDLKLMSEKTIFPHGKMPGSSNYKIYLFKAQKTGKASLLMEYESPGTRYKDQATYEVIIE